MSDNEIAIIGKPYGYNTWRRLSILPGLLIVAMLVVVSFRSDSSGLRVLFLLFAVGIIALPGLAVLYSITLYPEEIQVGYFRKQQTLRWSDIDEFKSIGMGAAMYTLHSRSRNAKAMIDPDVVDFPIINEHIRRRLPNLWNDYHEKEFLLDKVYTYLPMGTVVIVALPAFAWLLLEDIFLALPAAIFVTLFAAATLVQLLRSYRSLTVSGKSLHLQPMIGAMRTIAIDEIEAISLEGRRFGSRFRQGKQYVVLLTLKTAEKLRISNLNAGAPVLVNFLRNWLEAERLGMS